MTTSVPAASRTKPGEPDALARPARPPWWANAAGLVVYATVLFVAVLWTTSGEPAALVAGAGAAITSVGRLGGLISSDLMLWQVLAMARVPWLERSLGQDRLTRWHRVLGFTSISLMAAHIVLITLGYALLDGSPLLTEFWSLVTTAPGMLLATAATAAMVMVAVTSNRAARRRLRYESWHLLHLYAYLGVGLALPHQLWTGTSFLSSPAATVFWWGLWATAAAAVLAFRVVAPLSLSLRHRLVVDRVDVTGPDVVTIHISGRRLDQMRVAAGQFFVWRFLTGPGWTRGHPLSLSASPTTDGLRVTVGTRGDDGARLASMPPGTHVLIEGPYGRLTNDVRTRPGLALVGSGLGLAPLVAILQDAVRTGAMDRTATLVRRLRGSGPQPFDAELAVLEEAGWVRLVDLVGPRSTTGTPWLPADAGHVAGPEALRRLVPELEACDLYVCGAGPWATAVAVDALAAGVAHEALHVEHFTW
jgi:predicted ferric reductase